MADSGIMAARKTGSVAFTKVHREYPMNKGGIKDE